MSVIILLYFWVEGNFNQKKYYAILFNNKIHHVRLYDEELAIIKRGPHAYERDCVPLSNTGSPQCKPETIIDETHGHRTKWIRPEYEQFNDTESLTDDIDFLIEKCNEHLDNPIRQHMPDEYIY